MGFWTPLLELIFPPRCLLCGRFPGEDPAGLCTCRDCLALLPAPAQCCSRCGRPGSRQRLYCGHCSGRRFSFAGACAVDAYRGRLKKTVHDYKYRCRLRLSEPLGRLAARRVKETGWPEFSAVVPVPLHQSKLKERGFDQALLLARAVGSELGLPVQPVLQRVRSTPSQTKLGAEMRWQNVAGAFLALPGERVGGNLLLVDDLLTTGATAHNAALPLLAAGAGAVYLAVVAVAPGTS